MTESVEAKKSKDRSPSFPFITLERALDRARQFYAEEKRGAAPFARAVMHWRYTEASSGGLQTVAALKSYGLMEDVGGSRKDRQFKLSDLALRILLDQRPDSSERAAYMRQAALTPNVAAEVYERWPDGLPSDSTLNHFLVLERKFNEGSAANAVKILKENQGFANVAGSELESQYSELEIDKVIEAPNLNVVPSRAESTARQAQQSNVPVKSAAGVPLVLRNKGVTITLEFSEEPSQEIFGYLEKWAAFEKGNAPTKAELEAQAKAHSVGGDS